MNSINPRYAAEYLGELAREGRYFFTSADADRWLGRSRAAVKQALNRLRRKGEIASPGRGLYVIVPPEYRALGCLPPEQFIPALMARAGLPYYAGLLSAAQYHGAAHHRPQAFQVMLGRARRPIACGRVRVVFHVRKGIAGVPVQHVNTPRGTLAVSTPVATAFDLVGYEARVGGLDAVATLLAELAEKLDAEQLGDFAPQVPLPWVQRLGYLLEQLGAPAQAACLGAYVARHARETTPLQPSLPVAGHPRDRRWKLVINTAVEAEA